MSVDSYLLHKLSKDELIKIIEYQNRDIFVVYNANGSAYRARELNVDIDICVCNNEIDSKKKLLEMAKKAFDDEFDNIGNYFAWDVSDTEPEHDHHLVETLLNGFTMNELSHLKAEMLHKIFKNDDNLIEFINEFLIRYSQKMDCHINTVNVVKSKFIDKFTIELEAEEY